MKAAVRVPMPPPVRAKQFAPFQALNGLMEAILEAERIEMPRKILSPDKIEELDFVLRSLKKGQSISVMYYEKFEKSYILVSGTVAKVEPYFKLLQIDDRAFDFDEIDDIILT